MRDWSRSAKSKSRLSAKLTVGGSGAELPSKVSSIPSELTVHLLAVGDLSCAGAGSCVLYVLPWASLVGGSAVC